MKEPEQSQSCWPRDDSQFISIRFRCRAQHFRCTRSPRAPGELLWRYLLWNQKWARARLWARLPLPHPQQSPDSAPAYPACKALPGCFTRPPPSHSQCGKENRGLLSHMPGTKSSFSDHSIAPCPDRGLAQRALPTGHNPCCPAPGASP